MSSKHVGGQEDVVEFFRRAVDADRLAHAYLFLGPVGVGKAQFAKELTKYLFCLDRRDFESGSGELGSCGTCRNCRRVDHDNLPDLHNFSRPSDKRDIPIDLMREFQRQLSYKPVEGPYKVFVIEEADRLNVASANCLLKVLEEPPERSLILLLAEGQDNFLPTILSRVHVVRFKGVRIEELADALVKSNGMDAEEARFLARLSGGSPGRAHQLNEGGFYEVHRWLYERVGRMKPAENFDVAAEVRTRLGKQTSSVQQERELLQQHFDGLVLRFRDELAQACTSKNAHGQADRLRRALGAMLEAADAIAASGNIRLVLDNLFFDVAVALRGGL